MMDCNYCNGVGTVEEQTTRFCACEGTQPFFVENVPAFVCLLCGDKSYSGETITSLEKIRNGRIAATSAQFIQVFDFQRLDESENLAYVFSSHPDSESQSPKWFDFSYGVFGRQPEVVHPQSQYVLINPRKWDRTVIRVNEGWPDHVDHFPVHGIHSRIYSTSGQFITT